MTPDGGSVDWSGLDTAEIALGVALLSAAFTGITTGLNVAAFRRGARRVKFVGEPRVANHDGSPMLEIRVINLGSASERVTGVRFDRGKKAEGLEVPVTTTLDPESEGTVWVPCESLLRAWAGGGPLVNVDTAYVTLLVAPRREFSKSISWQYWNQMMRAIVAVAMTRIDESQARHQSPSDSLQDSS